ncbi:MULTISPECIES: carboxylating nicotinate-nucleotide diphosphorylase [unclassified Polynucleobacter]|jgi:nicotinate-nucleotide pyrophosphorylase (carboxylating)|uniref:carboxylating nicotinate-nucleotide diphosphorylase n=1 Tax=unclassified Polynucleobacter TaxID=2640945 RepID=UPI000BCA9470|nr:MULTISPECIES: carboxylating nicotinate-nucleotide diphosphorylase [unclassified Polynucleobacter]OYY20790.1 MAG: nicotinate-nucleotide diphosphorylase (carboxylating) [Polynucleobacter sp. 35-46-11]OZA77678.1 MAG: nicotinate-nucleotide diphosphorylase (carboxylating) [Polynucleobacter sp. 39-46-10]
MFDYNETLEQARQRNIADALMEDIGKCDWTAQLVPSKPVHAQLIVREQAVLCGVDWFEGTLKKLDPAVKVTWYYLEGDLMKSDTKVCDIEANSRALLSAERPCINFLQTLSWTASIARQHVEAIAGVSPNPKGCAVLDTRKTIPGLRQAQKYAVRVGGGQNQRLALWHGILIKENHIAAAGGVAAAVKAAQALNSGVDIQVEVENFAELKEALDAGAKSILIDNFTTEQMKEAVAFTNGRALLEASGGIDLDQMRAIAATGVDRISLGKLTKDIKAVDFSMRISA